MNIKNITSIIFGTAIAISTTLAVPANRIPMKHVQPNGDTITIVLNGDESFSYRTTIDGHLIRQNSQNHWVHCTAEASSRIVLTDLHVKDPGNRSSYDKMRLAQLDPVSSILRKESDMMVRRTITPPTAQTRSINTSKTLLNRGIVLLVEFSNKEFSMPNIESEYEGLLNGKNFSNNLGFTQSVRDYFDRNSFGNYNPQFKLMKKVKLDYPDSYYGKNTAGGGSSESNAPKMIVDAITKADFTGIDPNDYDQNGDGLVDFVYIVYAGKGEANGGDANTVWPHSWSLSNAKAHNNISSIPRLGNKSFDRYACSSEMSGPGAGDFEAIGTFCHEFSHILGLKDLYDVDYAGTNGTSYGVGTWSLMASGVHLDKGIRPAGLTAYERSELGWTQLTTLSSPGVYELQPLHESGAAYKIETANPNEYYILENRQQGGVDEKLYGHGMLIYHILYSQSAWQNNIINRDKNKPLFRIRPADNKENKLQTLATGDPFPGTALNHSFTNVSTPSALLWSGQLLDKPITQIVETGNTISFSFNEYPLIPHAVKATKQADGRFLLSWASDPNATDYQVDLFKRIGYTDSQIFTEDFMGTDSKTSLKNADWSTNCTTGYTSNTNYGKASPAIKFGNSSAYIQTPIFDVDVEQISFWYKGLNASSSTVNVNGLQNGNWINLMTFSGSVPTGTKTITSIPEGIRQVKYTYNYVVGNSIIDDIEITTAASLGAIVYEPGYENRSTGQQNSILLPEIDLSTPYFVRLRAVNGQYATPYCEQIRLTLGVSVDEIRSPTIRIVRSGSLSIRIFSDDLRIGQPIQVFDTMGRQISMQPFAIPDNTIELPTSGIYIVRIGTQSYKIAL